MIRFSVELYDEGNSHDLILNKYSDSQFTYHVYGRTFNVFNYISETNKISIPNFIIILRDIFATM